MPTDDKGAYSFGPLLAGLYQVMIDDNSADADENDWGDAGTTQVTPVATDGTATVDFNATIIRTASLSGMVTVDDEPMDGVTVTLTGDHAPEDNTMETDEDGSYSFDGLRKGAYTVSMENPNADSYNFPMMEQERDLSVGQKQTDVSFAGTRLKRASISGQVHAEGDAVANVAVKLSGDADAEDMTDENGEYNFPGLASGTYTVTISGWPEAAYNFAPAETAKERTIGSDEFAIVDFAGTHTETAVVSGMLFVDEVNSDGELTDGEPALDLSAEIAALQAAGVLPAAVTGIPLELTGPGLDDKTLGMATADGSYMFPGLRAGKYSVRVALDFKAEEDGPSVGDLLTGTGYRFSGESANPVAVAAAEESADNHLPFRITMQTIHVGAVMGTSKMATDTKVGGVQLILYPTIEDADAGTNALGTATTGADDTKPNYGMAKFDFARAMDLGPGGQGMDHLVFAKVVGSGNAALEVADNSHIEIQYNAIDRVSSASAAARLLNTAVNFQWWVKSKSGVPNGDRFLGGWNAVMGDTTIATGDSAHADATMKAAPADHGKGSFSGSVAIADLDDNAQAKYTVQLDVDSKDPAHDAKQPDGGEKWTQSAALSHTHNALELPAGNTAADNDLGPIYVTWTTQSVVVGVYRERDDVPGFIGHTSHRDEDDQRPVARVAAEMDVVVMKRNDRNRLEKYEWYDHDNDPTTDPIHPALSIGANGLVTARYLPADEELTIRLAVGLNRVLVTEPQEYVETFGEDLTLGTTLGAFGAMSGGGPQVRLCTASIDTSHSDGDCATFGYQWTTGSVRGTTTPGKAGISVDLTAVTENHGATDGSKTTPATGRVSFPVRDGTYDVKATGNATWAVSNTPMHRVWCYHDEKADETGESRADSAWVGTACNETRNWALTEKGLEVRGYVANVSHEHLTVVRGDETFEGAELTISRYVRANAQDPAKPIGGAPIATTTVQSDGSFVFEGLDAGNYVITAKNTSLYEALQSHPTDNVGGSARAAKYVAITDERLLLGKLPRWDYENSQGGTAVPISRVIVGSGANAVNMTFHNFALLHKDGTFSGRVVEASARHGGIAVELRRCLVYTPADPGDPDNNIDPTPESCSDDVAFAPSVQQTRSSGTWTFPGLREGYYQVNLAATGYLRAKWDATNGINDDAADCGPGTDGATCDQDRTVRQFDDLRGKTAFNETPAVYYVYNGNLASNDVATAVAVTGVTSNGATAVDLTGNFVAPAILQVGFTEALGATDNPVSWEAARIAVRATVANTASYVVINETALGDPSYTPSALTGASVPLTYNQTATGIGPNGNPDNNPAGAPANDITIRVMAQNGYNDHDYTFTATRLNPVGNQLEAAEVQYASTFAQSGDGASGTPFLVETASATANTVIVTFDLEEVAGNTAIDTKCAQSVAVWAPGATSAMAAASDADADFCSGEQYLLSAGTSGTTYRVVITSEDGRDWTYYVNVSKP